MRACREAKRIRDRLRKREAKLNRKRGKRVNGGTGWIDSPWLDRLIKNSKRNYRRNRANRTDAQVTDTERK